MAMILVAVLALAIGFTSASDPDVVDGFANPLTSPNYSVYHQSSVLLAEVRALAARHPSIMNLEVQRLNASGYVAEVQVVTVAANISRVDPRKRLRVLLDFGQHARELITSEIALRLLQILSGEHAVEEELTVHRILETSVLKIVPLENHNGRKVVENGDLCERKNGRGVDTNRNWDLDWGLKEKDYNSAEEYPGTSPFSEPEAKIMQHVARGFSPHLWVNVHSGIEALLMPYDHKHAPPAHGLEKPMEMLLQTLNKMHFDGSCTVGSGGSAVGYLAHGTATDYIYDVLKVPLAFTFEVYGEEEVDFRDCFRMFNPVDLSVFEAVVSSWSLSFITLASSLPATLQELNRIRNFGSRKLGWSSDPFSSQEETVLLQIKLLVSLSLMVYIFWIWRRYKLR